MNDITMNGAEQALRYLQGELSGDESAMFEQYLTESEQARQELERAREILNALNVSRDDAVVTAVNTLIREAILRGASDIHLIPERPDTPIKAFYRVSGALIEVPFPTPTPLTWQQATPLINRIKLMSEMNLLERILPQDGRIPVRCRERDYDLRVSVRPTLYGERVTIHIIAKNGFPIGLDSLNLPAATVETLRRLADLPSGLILATGRANSGRSTLLYSLLKEMQGEGKRRRAILTAEDPVELVLEGVSQSAAHAGKGLTLSTLIRSFMRADADVVYCSALPDAETVHQLLRNVETGSLALSALTGPDALTAIDQLTDRGVARYRLAEVAAGFIGLRLVGKICDSCQERYAPNPDDLDALDLSPVEDGPFWRGAGCEKCGGTGFSGRVPLVEVAVFDGPIRRRIARGVSVSDLWTELFGAGGSLRDAARAAVRGRQTTVEAANAALMDYPHRATPMRQFSPPDLSALQNWLYVEKR